MVRSVRLRDPYPSAPNPITGGFLEDMTAGARLPTVLAGAAAGVIGSIVQAGIGKSEELAFLPEREDSNIAPRLMDRLAGAVGEDLPTPAAWALGTAFHVGYGAVWGGLYALAREHRPIHPLFGGLAMGGIIYAITFPPWGGAVQTGTERPPKRRSWGMEVVAVSVALGFGVATAAVYERIRPDPAMR